MLQLRIPPPAYLLVFGFLMWSIANKWLPEFTWLESPWNYIGFPFMALAFLMDVTALVQFVRAKTTPNPFTPSKTSELVTKGMYRFSRNPMYVGLLFWLVGWALYLGNFISFLLIPLFMLVLTVQQIKPEEIILEQKFGQAYLAYKKRVRRWF